MSRQRATAAAIAALTAVATLLLAGCGSSRATAPLQPAGAVSDAGAAKSGAPVPSGPDPSSTAERIKALGESVGGNQYAGLALDRATSTVTVWRVPGNDSLDQALLGAAVPGVTVQLKTAQHSLQELNQVRDAIMSEYGPQLVGSAIPPDGSSVEVMVQQDHLALASQIKQLGPAGTVTVQVGEGGPT